MKLAFSTLGCPHWSWDKVLAEASNMGYDGIELRCVEGELYLPKARPFLANQIESTLAELRRRNLEIVAVDASSAFHDAKAYDASLAEGRAAIDLACRLGSPYIRVFGNIIPEPAAKDETIGRIIGGLRELCLYCSGKGVSVLLETHGDFSDLSNLSPVLDGMGIDHFGLLWDIEHTFTIYGEDISAFLGKAYGYIRHTHIKDTKKTADGYQLCLTGNGDVPFGKILNHMKALGYDGYLSFEWEKKWHADLEEPEIAFPGYIDYMNGLLRA
jgi:sugar phosphate isomerase/epimerase